MPNFPLLKSGAVCQYPLERRAGYKTDVVRFTDGGEQRYREWGSVERVWVAKLEALDEAEQAAIEEFFLANGGRAGTFTFTDPYDGQAYDHCEADLDAAVMENREYGRADTVLVIRQRR